MAKSGFPVKTRNGEKVRILCFDRIASTPIVALVKIRDTLEKVYQYYNNGRWINSIEVVTDGKYEVVIKTKGRMGTDSGLPHCPNCGSYNYEVGLPSSAHNRKCRKCGTLVFWYFNM